jgi:hypothetical protein
MAETIGRGKRVGMCFFELDRISDLEGDHCRALDTVLTSTTFHRDILRRAGCHAEYIPLGVDRTIFYEYVNAAALPVSKGATVFMVIGKFEQRKSHPEILDAFNKAFAPTDNVALVVFGHNPFLIKRNPDGSILSDGNKEWANYFKYTAMGERIIIANRLETSQEVARAIAASDCLLCPSRAEGFSLPTLEALSMGKIVIATNRTAFADYPSDAFQLSTDELDDDYTMMRSIDMRVELEAVPSEPAFDGIFFNGQGNWYSWGADQTEQLIEKMRMVHRLKQSGGLRVNHAGISLGKQWTWSNSASKILEVLQS